MRLLLTSTLLLAGCGSSWDIRKGDSLVIGCAESFFYADSDADGWGDPTSEPALLCEADVEAGLTASNGRDCDDANEAITGKIGPACPIQMVPGLDGADPAHAGVLFDQKEFAFLYGADTLVTANAEAATNCTLWGKAPALDPEGALAGTLATFGSQPELAAVLDAVKAEVDANGSGVYAGFVGIHWDGANHYTGAWSFVDDSDDALIETGLNWCNGEPMPADFFPLLNGGDASNPGEPGHVDAINALLPDLRLALVLEESGDWCLGLPEDAIPDAMYAELQAGTADLNDPYVAELARYTSSDAHMVCGRPKPNPADYVHFSDSGEETGTGTE